MIFGFSMIMLICGGLFVDEDAFVDFKRVNRWGAVVVGWGIDEMDIAKGVISKQSVFVGCQVVIGQWLIKQYMLIFIAVQVFSAVESVVSWTSHTVIVNLAEGTFLVIGIVIMTFCEL